METNEVCAFISLHVLSTSYQETVKLINKHFSLINKVEVEISVDPDEPENKEILFRLFFSTSPEVIREKWKLFLQEFTENIPYENRRLLSVELIP